MSSAHFLRMVDSIGALLILINRYRCDFIVQVAIGRCDVKSGGGCRCMLCYGWVCCHLSAVVLHEVLLAAELMLLVSDLL